MLKLLLSPGIKVVSQLSIAKKFALIFTLYLIPVGYVAHYTLTKHSQEIEKTNQEIEKLTIINTFKPILENMAKSRGLTHAFLNGNQSVKNDIDSTTQILKKKLDTLINLDTFKDLKSAESSEARAIQTDWNQLVLISPSMDTKKNFKSYSNIINRVSLLMNNILESSTLFTDSGHQSSFLIQMTVKNLPSIVDVIGKTRGIGTGVSTQGKFDADTFIALSNHNKQLQQLRSKMAHNFKSANSLGENLKELSRSFEQIDHKIIKFINTTSDKLLIPDSVEIEATQYFDEGTQLIDSVLNLYDSCYNELINLLIKRKTNIQSDIFINVFSSLLLVIAALYLFSSVYMNMLDSISKIEKCVNTVAEGDFTSNISINSKDEMKNIGDDLNRMISNTKNLVRQVLQTTKELVISAEQNRQSAIATSDKIDHQNIKVEQVATAMNEMSATVQEVARNAEQTAESTASADKDSINGFHTVKSTIVSINELESEISKASTSIDKLQDDVKDISSVLDVIQGIADQTNLLALNAAIEAARAGESGRGFAVVADEVRALASKTQESTEEIRNMISILQTSAGHSVSSMQIGNSKIKLTVDHANRAGEALKKISESVAQISLMGEQIASAATEQSTVAEEINKNIISVNDISLLTKQSAKDSSDSSQFVDQASKNLQELVGHFKV